jgi:hypothetical protein
MVEKKFTHFLVRESDLMVQIELLFSETTPEIEQEIRGFLTTLYFAAGTNIQIDLGGMKSISLKTSTFLVHLGKELAISNLKLILLNTPAPTAKFFKTFQFDSFISLRSHTT